MESNKSQRTILLIDDDRAMSEMLAEFLGPEGYSVHLTFTAKGGMRAAVEGGFVLIILDVMLRDMSGSDVPSMIRKNSHIPVIMLTTRSGVNDRISGLEAGADDYIPNLSRPPSYWREFARSCGADNLPGMALHSSSLTT